MNNVTAKVEGNELVIRLPLLEPHPSKSGKTLIVADSDGTMETSAQSNGLNIWVGVKAFIKHRRSPLAHLNPDANVE